MTRLGITDAHLGVSDTELEASIFAPYDPSKERDRIRNQNMELSRHITSYRSKIGETTELNWGEPFTEAYKRINKKRRTSLFNGDYYKNAVDVDVLKTVNIELRSILKEIGAKAND